MGSHYHFVEVNKYLQFDRAAAFGTRLVSTINVLNKEFNNQFIQSCDQVMFLVYLFILLTVNYCKVRDINGSGDIIHI